MESVGPRERKLGSEMRRRTCGRMDFPDVEVVDLTVKRHVENSGVKGKKFGDAENISRGTQRLGEGRRALRDANRLYMYTAGPGKTIDRPLTPIVKPQNRFRSLPPQKLKYLNPCAKYTKVPLVISKTPSKPQKQPPPEHLYGCLSTKKRSSSASQDEAVDVYEFHGSDSDDCLQIPNENESKVSARSSAAAEDIVDYRDMPKLKKEKLEPKIVPAFSPEVLEQLRNEMSLEPKLRIREEKIYHEENFNVRKFLKTSMNPNDYFISGTRKCNYNSTSFDFLRNTFPKVPAKTIRNIYEEANYAMTMTAYFLSELIIPERIPRPLCSIEAEDLSQLQEMEYIKNLLTWLEKNTKCD